MKRVKVVNGQIRWNDCDMTWEADPRHVKILARHLGIEEAKPVMSP